MRIMETRIPIKSIKNGLSVTGCCLFLVYIVEEGQFMQKSQLLGCLISQFCFTTLLIISDTF